MPANATGKPAVMARPAVANETSDECAIARVASDKVFGTYLSGSNPPILN